MKPMALLEQTYMELVDVKRLPALVRRLTTEGEARPNGAFKRPRSLPLTVKSNPPCRVFPTWTLTKSEYGIGATGSMAVSKTVDVGSSPTCCAYFSYRLWEKASESSCGGSSFSRPA